MPSTIKIAIFFGGRTAEHEVSVQSARNIIAALDKNRFDPVLIGIDHQGRWFLFPEGIPPELETVESSGNALPTPIGAGGLMANEIADADVFFPVLHGPYGEDGSIQGLAQLADLPCVGSGILGSAIGMDKDIMKKLLDHAGIANARSQLLVRNEPLPSTSQIADLLGWPLFVKPANMGSSVGVSKVENEQELSEAIAHAFEFDHKVLVEKAVIGRELEVAVLGNRGNLEVSDVGEINPHTSFYSYESKYLNADGADLAIPAKLERAQRDNIRQLAATVFSLLQCSGLARVDMFLQADNQIFINEINTLPGFTNISMYPKLWEYSGLKQTDLISRLIDLAIEHHQSLSSLKSFR